MFNRIPEFFCAAPSGTRPISARHGTVSDFLRIVHQGPAFQAADGYIELNKMELSDHGHKEEHSVGYDWLFEKAYYGRVYIIWLFEASIVDHAALIDYRR